MSRAFNGGSKTFEDQEVPTNKEEVIELLREFIQSEFYYEDVAEDITQNDPNSTSHNIVKMGEELELGSRAEGEIVASGSFVYPATKHSVQTIWKNKFEIRENEDGVSVYVSNWYGTTLESWEKQVKEHELHGL